MASTPDSLTPVELAAKALAMAQKGTDVRTIWMHFETVLGRKLTTDEGQALQDAWRAAAPERAAKYHRQGQAAADEARALRKGAR